MFLVSGPDFSAVLAWRAVHGMREHSWIRRSNEREGLVWLNLWNALNSIYLAGRERWPGSSKRTRLPCCSITCQPHPSYGKCWVHLPGQRQCQELRIGSRGGGKDTCLLQDSLCPICFLGITYSGTSCKFFLWLSESLVQFVLKPKEICFSAFSSSWVWHSSEWMKYSINNISSDGISTKSKMNLFCSQHSSSFDLKEQMRLNSSAINSWNLSRTVCRDHYFFPWIHWQGN